MTRIEEEDVPEAEEFQSVSILHTGLHDFSKMSAKFHPSEVRQSKNTFHQLATERN